MHQNFRCLRPGQSVVHRSVEVVRDLRNLSRGDERTHRDKTTVARREIRTQPYVLEQKIAGLVHQALRDRADILLNRWGTLRLCGLVQRQ